LQINNPASQSKYIHCRET